jgi:hypothetical protein
MQLPEVSFLFRVTPAASLPSSLENRTCFLSSLPLGTEGGGGNLPTTSRDVGKLESPR